MDKKYHTIKVTNTDGEHIEFKMHWEAEMIEWINKFKQILKWLTYTDKLVESVFTVDECGQPKDG